MFSLMWRGDLRKLMEWKYFEAERFYQNNIISPSMSRPVNTMQRNEKTNTKICHTGWIEWKKKATLSDECKI
jgi:hypothetical protein